MGQRQSSLNSEILDSLRNNNETVLPQVFFRWFYKKGDAKNWTPLNGQDSLAIENGYRRHCQLLANRDAAVLDEKSARENTEILASGTWANTAIALVGMYRLQYSEDAADFRYHLSPLYFKGDNISLRRGSWFLKQGGEWHPLEGISIELAQKVEEKHLNYTSSQNAAKPPDIVDAATGLRISWRNVDDLRVFDDGQSSVFSRLFNFGSNGRMLRRGYFTKADVKDGSLPISDLVLVVHGIGQRRTPGKIVKDVEQIQDISEKLMRKNFAATTTRPLFVPIDWRTGLDLEEHLLPLVTPRTCTKVRDYFVSNVADLFYYGNPGGYTSSIMTSLRTALNQAYSTFVLHNPDFDKNGGRVSVAAHSLGSVLCFDILTGQKVGFAAEVLANANLMPSQLLFSVKHFFGVGSPLGLFLSTRRKECRPNFSAAGFGIKFSNVYHPLDAVASRVEPLFSSIYADVYPLRINKFDAVSQIAYGSMQAMAIVEGKKVGAQIPPDQMITDRIDFALQSDWIPGSELKAAFASHFAYWSNPDVCNFILTKLYGERML